MSQHNNIGLQLICVHAGLLFALLFGIGFFGFTGWLPPMSPGDDAVVVQAIFVEHKYSIRVGVLFAAIFCALFWPLAAVISIQLRRIEGRHSAMTLTQFGAASGTIIAIMISAYIWLALSYRPELMEPRSAQLLNDFAWLMFVGAFGPALVQNIAIALCVLSDTQSNPVYPRWVGYANLWLILTFLPGLLLPFFKHGPFAWNGVIGFWVVAVGFFAWILIMWWTTLKAVKQLQTA